MQMYGISSAHIRFSCRKCAGFITNFQFPVSLIGVPFSSFAFYHGFLFLYLLMHCLLISSIYGVHDEAKDKAFELEMHWVCDESNRQHQKVK